MVGEISASRLSDAHSAVSIARALHTKTTKGFLVNFLFFAIVCVRRGERGRAGTMAFCGDGRWGGKRRTQPGNNFAMTIRAAASGRPVPGRAEKRRLDGGSRRPLLTRALDAIRRATRPTLQGRRRAMPFRLPSLPSSSHRRLDRVWWWDHRRRRVIV